MITKYTIKEITFLWETFLTGDEHAFSKLYCLLFEELIMFGCNYYNDKEVIEDLVQDIFVCIICRKFRVEEIQVLRPFLYKTLKNKIYNYLKKKSRQISLNSEDDLDFKLLIHIDEPLNKSDNFQIDKVLSNLTTRQKEIINLRFVNDLSHEEIAEILGINVQSVYNLLSRSVEKLRKTHAMTEE